MGWYEKLTARMRLEISKITRDDRRRVELMFRYLNLVLAFIALFMAVVNLFTKEYVLMCATLLYGVACFLNVVALRSFQTAHKAIMICFQIESIFLLTFFLVSGVLNGFSVLWLCLIPSFSMLVFDKQYGKVFSLITFAITIFFFWLPLGRGLLQYRYTDAFMLRFPLYYLATFAVAGLVEMVYSETKQQLLKSEEEYHHLYRHDALTGIYNRYGFRERMEQTMPDSRHAAAIFMVDVDSFKMVNDRYGHTVGDQVLQEISNTIISTLCSHSVFCRWGGEEFLVFLNCPHDHMQVAEQLRKNIEDLQIPCEDETVQVTVSIGVCMQAFAPDHSNLNNMIKLADQCLNEAKRNGKNCIRCKKI